MSTLSSAVGEAIASEPRAPVPLFAGTPTAAILDWRHQQGQRINNELFIINLATVQAEGILIQVLPA